MLSVHLANIKSSGVYRFVFDKSEIPGQLPQTMRLVVGYSEKGPFNTVTYVKNGSEFIELYGNISKKLEKYGCFFHRLALQCLSKEPILCLNLKKFSPYDSASMTGTRSSYANVAGGFEAVQGVSFNPYAESSQFVDACIKDIEVEKIFDTSRLWTLSPEKLPAAIDSVQADAAKYITLAVTDTKKNSATVFMRPSLEKGYDITLRDWYNNYCNGDYPEYVEDYLDTLVSDYLVDAYIFNGKFTKEIASSDSFCEYFTISEDGSIAVKDYVENAYGEKKDALYALSQVEGSGFVVRYTGSILPYFKNTDGSWMSLDLVINNDTTLHGVMMYIDEEMLEGDNFGISNINLGGYNNDFDMDNLGTLTNVNYFTDKNPVYMYNVWKLDSNTVDTAANANCSCVIDASASCNDFTYGDPAVDFFPVQATQDTPSYSDEHITLASDGITAWVSCYVPINKGDMFIADESTDMNLVTVMSIERIPLNEDKQSGGVDGKGCAQKITFNAKPDITNEYLIRYNHKLTAHAGDAAPIIGIDAVDAVYFTQTEIDAAVEGDAAYGKTTADIKTPAVEGVAAVDYTNDAHVGVYLEGYTYLDGKPVNSSSYQKNAWINSQLDVLKNRGIREALTNSTDTDYRYIIDTFEAFPEDGLRARLASLAKEKENAIVISNFPAMKTFAKDSSFCDAKGLLATKYIASGYNKSKASTSMISMPSEANGASFIAFYTPLKFNDNGLKINVPSAGLVSNNFMDKYTSRQPYYVVAGPTYGLMNYDDMIGPDFNFTREDLDNLEPMGINCMIYKPRRGTFINANQTAKQKPFTGLSKLNIRELIIYLQDQIADMLQGHQWELNTQVLRDTIKRKADIICGAVQSNGGLYDFNNVCDDTNNTEEVIDNEMIVLSTSIEPAKAAGKMVHELTIYRKGGMSSVIK